MSGPGRSSTYLKEETLLQKLSPKLQAPHGILDGLIVSLAFADCTSL